VPCVAAHQSAGLVASMPHEASDAHSGDSHAGDEHAAHETAPHGPAAHDDMHDGPTASTHGPCIYCPPHHAGHEGADEAGGRCAFPHDPQVDARVAALAIAPPVALTSFALPPEPAQTALRLTADRPEPVPRCPLTVSYCRFNE